MVLFFKGPKEKNAECKMQNAELGKREIRAKGLRPMAEIGDKGKGKRESTISFPKIILTHHPIIFDKYKLFLVGEGVRLRRNEAGLRPVKRLTA